MDQMVKDAHEAFGEAEAEREEDLDDKLREQALERFEEAAECERDNRREVVGNAGVAADPSDVTNAASFGSSRYVAARRSTARPSCQPYTVPSGRAAPAKRAAVSVHPVSGSHAAANRQCVGW